MFSMNKMRGLNHNTWYCKTLLKRFTGKPNKYVEKIMYTFNHFYHGTGELLIFNQIIADEDSIQRVEPNTTFNVIEYMHQPQTYPLPPLPK